MMEYVNKTKMEIPNAESSVSEGDYSDRGGSPITSDFRTADEFVMDSTDDASAISSIYSPSSFTSGMTKMVTDLKKYLSDECEEDDSSSSNSRENFSTEEIYHTPLRRHNSNLERGMQDQFNVESVQGKRKYRSMSGYSDTESELPHQKRLYYFEKLVDENSIEGAKKVVVRQKLLHSKPDVRAFLDSRNVILMERHIKELKGNVTDYSIISLYDKSYKILTFLEYFKKYGSYDI